MPTLIKLTPNERMRLGVAKLEVVQVSAGDPEPEFFSEPGGPWVENEQRGEPFHPEYYKNQYLFARRVTGLSRATQSEIDATRAEASPSVGRPADLSEDILWLPHSGPRVETGPLQFGDDWPGVFIRGDNAGWYALHLGELLGGVTEGIEKCQVAGLQGLLSGCILGPAKDLLREALDLWDMGQEANSSLTQMDRYRDLERQRDQIVVRAEAALAAAGKEST